MNSLEVFEFKGSIKHFMSDNKDKIPLEVQRLCLQEVLNELSTEIQNELYELVKEREATQKGDKK